MIVFPAPFSQVNGHLLPFQADELNPAPVDQGLQRCHSTTKPVSVTGVCPAQRLLHPGLLQEQVGLTPRRRGVQRAGRTGTHPCAVCAGRSPWSCPAGGSTRRFLAGRPGCCSATWSCSGLSEVHATVSLTPCGATTRPPPRAPRSMP